MKRTMFFTAAVALALGTLLVMGSTQYTNAAEHQLAANPCGGAANPCGGTANPCGGANPCAAAAEDNGIDASLVLRPKGTTLAKGDNATLIKEGKKLFSDTTLGTTDVACETCHENNGAFKASFAKPYPHFVAMANAKAKINTINLDEMIQVCMVIPMGAKPLPWDSRELAALTAYTATLQKSFAANPCGANPCGANPCGGNPCGGKK